MQGLSYDLIPSACHVFQVEWNFSLKFDVHFFDVYVKSPSLSYSCSTWPFFPWIPALGEVLSACWFGTASRFGAKASPTLDRLLCENSVNWAVFPSHLYFK